jgi:hypothetical protein
MTSLMIDDSRTLWHRMTVRATRNKGAKTLMDSTPPRSSKPPGPTHAGSDCTTGNTCRKPKPLGLELREITNFMALFSVGGDANHPRKRKGKTSPATE